MPCVGQTTKGGLNPENNTGSNLEMQGDIFIWKGNTLYKVWNIS